MDERAQEVPTYDVDGVGERYTRHRHDVLAGPNPSGFTLTALRECAPDPTRFPAGDDTELRRRRRVPLFLLLAASRDDEPRAVGAAPAERVGAPHPPAG
ncbi:hypothetical protein GTR02_06995 [Kineococcus sp. R8]|uniref:hypothetical protein n=1 Tax=Kineococcus siccus TaxID=2696567 RepID=UPI0014123023|nr:hypothetical protein [Kineococcus siccus]NAZ81562.1 hypothetical protein [Kineococcus siccus]